VAGTAAAVAIGSVADAVPDNCVPVVYRGTSYQHCGDVWYQPQYVGSTLQYVVVAAPW
jgi:hypothetical protein